MRSPWRNNPLTSTESRAARPPRADDKAKSCCCCEYLRVILDYPGWLYVEFLLLLGELISIINKLAQLGKLECLQGTLMAAREMSASLYANPLAASLIPANGLQELRTYLGVSLALGIPCFGYFWWAFFRKSEGYLAFARQWRELAGGFGECGSDYIACHAIFNGPRLCTITGLAVGVLGYMALSIVRQMENATPKGQLPPTKWCAGKGLLSTSPFFPP